MNNIQGSVIAGGSVSNSNNNNRNKNSEKNEIVFQVRKEAAIISFIVGIVTSILGSIIYNMFLGN